MGLVVDIFPYFDFFFGFWGVFLSESLFLSRPSVPYFKKNSQRTVTEHLQAVDAEMFFCLCLTWCWSRW